MMEKSLVDIAKEFEPGKAQFKTITHADMELAVAWGRYEVTKTQVEKAKRLKYGSGSSYLLRALREAIRTGYISET